MSTERDLAILILGASGVTGRQAVAYMGGRGSELGVRWGIGGRDPARLEALIEGFDRDERPELLRVDLSEPSSVAAAIPRAAAIVNFAGPFARLAPPVIEACVESGTAYIDVSGEIAFVSAVIDRWHRPAVERGVKLVQVAGFEALPFDLAAAAAIARLADEHGQQPALIEAVLSAKPPPGMPRPSDMVSQGTVESLRGQIAGQNAELLGDPSALVGDLVSAERVRAASPIRNRPRWRRGIGPIAPMIPSPVINPPVIQRSLALAGIDPIPYREGVAASSLVPTRPAQAAVAGAAAALNGVLSLLSKASPRVRRGAARAIKPLSPSGGPREDRLAAWSWRIDCTVTGSGGAEAIVRVEADGHPGYLTTSKMTTEAGLILADPGDQAPEAAGCLTPSAALGTAQLDRFASAGMRFS